MLITQQCQKNTDNRHLNGCKTPVITAIYTMLLEGGAGGGEEGGVAAENGGYA